MKAPAAFKPSDYQSKLLLLPRLLLPSPSTPPTAPFSFTATSSFPKPGRGRTLSPSLRNTVMCELPSQDSVLVSFLSPCPAFLFHGPKIARNQILSERSRTQHLTFFFKTVSVRLILDGLKPVIPSLSSPSLLHRPKSAINLFFISAERFTREFVTR